MSSIYSMADLFSMTISLDCQNNFYFYLSHLKVDNKGIQNMVSEYNKNLNEVNIHLSLIMGSEGSVVPTIKLNGEVRNINAENFIQTNKK